MYTIAKIGGLYRVVTISNQRILFSSARRINCKDFMRESLGIDDTKKEQAEQTKERQAA